MIEEGFLDEVEDLVSDFKKVNEKDKHSDVFDWVKEYIDKPDMNISPYHARTLQYLNEATQQEIFRQEYPDKIYHNIIQATCQCGRQYTVYMERLVEIGEMVRRIPGDFGESRDMTLYRKSFFCMGCGVVNYIRGDTEFEITAIKHDERFKI